MSEISHSIYEAYRREVLEHQATKKRMLTQIRHLLVEAHQLHTELEQSREREEQLMKQLLSM